MKSVSKRNIEGLEIGTSGFEPLLRLMWGINIVRTENLKHGYI